MRLPWQEAHSLERAGLSFVLVTLIAVKGHAPQEVGAKMIVTADGIFAGTVGGGNVEAKCIEFGKRVLAASEIFSPEIVHWNLQRDVGMTCGGEVTLLFELIQPKPWRIIVFGAGHVGQSLANLLGTLDCRATFIDDRPEWTNRLPDFPNLEKVCLNPPAQYLDLLKKEKGSRPYFVIMTKGHVTDVEVLKAVFAQYPQAPYFGVIASKVKAIKIRNELKNEGYSSDFISSLHCPMGLELGSNDPAEIAVSIAAQLLQIRDRDLNPARVHSTLNADESRNF